MKSCVICMLVTVWSCTGLAQVASAQNSSAEQEVRNDYNINAMIDQAVMNISTRYNLNQEQHEITQRMMKEGVYRFLEEHADQVYPLIRDLTRVGLDPSKLNGDQLSRIGKAGEPLVEVAKQMILEYNRQWHDILSEEQQLLHEWDLREMDGQFVEIRDRFGRMSEGEPVDNPLFPEPNIQTTEPPRPKKPAGIPKVKKKTGGTQHVSGLDEVFDNYVQKFIKDYGLDAGQRDAARSILREYKGHADLYRKVKKSAYAQANKKAEEARKSGDIKKLKEADREIDKLNERIVELLAEMKKRLMTIPRESQKRAFKESAGKAGQASAKQNKGTAAEPDKSKPDDKPGKSKPTPGKAAPKGR